MGINLITARGKGASLLLIVFVLAMGGSESLAADIAGPDEIKAGEILVLTGTLEAGSRHRWILPDGLQPVAQTGKQIAIIPAQIGPLEIILVEVTETSITVARFTCLIHKHPSSRAATSATRPVNVTSEPRPPPILVVMHSADPCPACDKWRAEEFPKIAAGWQFSEVKDSPDVSVFPSFEIHASGKKHYFEGYLSAAQIQIEITSMESER